jgi:hypothetical protein
MRRSLSVSTGMGLSIEAVTAFIVNPFFRIKLISDD